MLVVYNYFDFNPPIITNTVNTAIVASLSIDDEDIQNIRIFPNPVKNKLEITSSTVIDRLTIIGINGRVLSSIEIFTTDYILDVSDLSNGMYFIELKSGNLKSTKKFIKN